VPRVNDREELWNILQARRIVADHTAEMAKQVRRLGLGLMRTAHTRQISAFALVGGGCSQKNRSKLLVEKFCWFHGATRSPALGCAGPLPATAHLGAHRPSVGPTSPPQSPPPPLPALDPPPAAALGAAPRPAPPRPASQPGPDRLAPRAACAADAAGRHAVSLWRASGRRAAEHSRRHAGAEGTAEGRRPGGGLAVQRPGGGRAGTCGRVPGLKLNVARSASQPPG